MYNLLVNDDILTYQFSLGGPVASIDTESLVFVLMGLEYMPSYNARYLV